MENAVFAAVRETIGWVDGATCISMERGVNAFSCVSIQHDEECE